MKAQVTTKPLTPVLDHATGIIHTEEVCLEHIIDGEPFEAIEAAERKGIRCATCSFENVPHRSPKPTLRSISDPVERAEVLELVNSYAHLEEECETPCREYCAGIRDLAAKVAQIGLVVIFCLMLSLPIPAQTSTQPLLPVSRCIAGAYDECRLKDGHWYTRMGTEWRDDKGAVVKEPVIPATVCPTTLATLRVGDPPATIANSPAWPIVDKPSRFSRSFWFSSAAFGASSAFDFTSSRGLHENNGAVANSQGHVSGSKFVAFNGALYGSTLLIQIKWPKAANAIRYILTGFHVSAGIHNEVIK